MTRFDAMQEKFEEVMVLGRPALFTDVRIERDTVPDDLYLYEVRGDDDGGGDPVQIAKGILVNHFGSIIVREPIGLPPDGYLDIGPENDWNFAGGNCRTVKEFQERAHVEGLTLAGCKEMENTAITKELMRIDTRKQVIDI